MTTSLESLVSQMTIAELSQRAGVSIREVVEMVLGSDADAGAQAPTDKPRRGRPPKAKAAGRPAKGKAKAKAAGKKTRGGANRAEYDQRVLGVLRASKGKVGATELRKKAGGTPPSLRASLARLIEAGYVKSQGKARGTTYIAA